MHAVYRDTHTQTHTRIDNTWLSKSIGKCIDYIIHLHKWHFKYRENCIDSAALRMRNICNLRPTCCCFWANTATDRQAYTHVHIHTYCILPYLSVCVCVFVCVACKLLFIVFYLNCCLITTSQIAVKLVQGRVRAGTRPRGQCANDFILEQLRRIQVSPLVRFVVYD